MIRVLHIVASGVCQTLYAYPNMFMRDKHWVFDWRKFDGNMLPSNLRMPMNKRVRAPARLADADRARMKEGPLPSPSQP